MGTPPEVLDEAVTYLRIYFLGMPFIMAFNFGAAILRSMGDTRRPLYILVMAGVVNTLLNLLFVICFRMGVAGVAVATGIANAVSATLIIRLLRKEKEPFRLHFEKLKIHTGELSRMFDIFHLQCRGTVVHQQLRSRCDSRFIGGAQLRVLLLFHYPRF